MDEFTIHIPRERPFSAVADLVVGGIAARHDVTLDVLDDLQLALDTLLEHDEADERQVGIVVLEQRVEGELEIVQHVERDVVTGRDSPHHEVCDGREGALSRDVDRELFHLDRRVVGGAQLVGEVALAPGGRLLAGANRLGPVAMLSLIHI